MSEKCAIYCLSYKNEKRRKNMQNRFDQVGLNVQFYHGVDTETDPRIKPDDYTKCISCMYGHLDMINMFLSDSDKPYGIFCEDDIYLHKDFHKRLDEITSEFTNLNLDVLLLGHLITYSPDPNYCLSITQNHRFYNYGEDTWGTQMYMISRSYAKQLLGRYYGEVRPSDPPFSADWTITKDGSRAFLFPMLAVEDGETQIEHYGQHQFHQAVFRNNYNAIEYI